MSFVARAYTATKGTVMGSSGRNGTTMAKLNREGKLREKRAEKEARKAARKLTAAYDAESESQPEELDGDSSGLDGDSSGLEDGPDEAGAAVAESSSHTAALGI